MDDSTFHIPNQPDNSDNNRPEGADSAADIARSKLNAIYDKHDTASQQTAQPSTPHQDQTPQTFQPQSTPTPEATPQQPAAPSYHELKQHAAALEDSTSHQEPVQPAQPQPTTTPGDSSTETQSTNHNPHHSHSHEQQPTHYQYDQQPTSYQPSHQPEPTPVQPQSNIIQPTPAETAPEDALLFAPPGSASTANQQPTSDYIPAQQYAQEVSLEDQIDGLRHTAPDHQLPIQAQKEAKKSWIPYSLQPFLRTLALAAVIAIIYNHQFLVGQVQSYINPAQSVVSPTIIAPSMGENVSDENKLVIPKINVDIPVVYDVTTFEESAVQAGLERGVVHYGTTAVPGENGNNVIVGHSSNNFWNNGEYKFAFVLLNKLNEGDTFTLHYEGTAYTYEVFRRKVVPPTAVDVIFEDFGEPVVTLITCDPPGTAWNRLVVNARQISPDPDSATAPQQQSGQPDEVINVPSNSSSLLENLFN